MKRPQKDHAPLVSASEAGVSTKQATSLQPDFTAAATFLQWLDPAADAWHLRTFPDAGTGPGHNYTGTLDQHAAALAADNAVGRGCFVVINEGGHKAADITRTRALFADLDGADLEPVLAGPLLPHIVVESSPARWHCYWLCDGLPLDQFRGVQQAIAARFGSDPSVIDLPRVMRLPGLVHHKGEPFLSHIVRLHKAPRYTADEILAAFPPVARAAAEPAERNAGGAIETGRHEDLVRHSRRLVLSGMDRADALATLQAMDAAGRWSRDMAPDEIARAVDGALLKLAGGEWQQVVDPADVFGKQPLPDGAEPLNSLAPVDLRNIMQATIEPIRYALAPLLPRGFVSLIGGHGGTGKSYLALVICVHVATGRPWAGFAVEQGPALFVSLEDRSELMRLRVRHVIAAYGLDAGAVSRNLRVVDGSAGLTALLREAPGYGGSRPMVTTPTFDDLARIVGDAVLVVIDGASEAYDGSENDKRQVRAFVRKLATLGGSNQPAVALTAHVDKASAKFGAMGNSYIGSVQWHNSTRSRLALTRDGERGQLVQEKLNLGRKLDAPVCLRWNDYGVPLPDLDATAAAEAEAGLSDADGVLAAMLAAVADGVIVGTGRSGSATTQKILENLPELPRQLQGASGRKRFWVAVADLQRAGKISIAEYQAPGRHTRQKYVINAAPIAPIAPIPRMRATSATRAPMCAP